MRQYWCACVISGDVDAGLIQYVLRPGENATEDTFFFKIVDAGEWTQPSWCGEQILKKRTILSWCHFVLWTVQKESKYICY